LALFLRASVIRDWHSPFTFPLHIPPSHSPHTCSPLLAPVRLLISGNLQEILWLPILLPPPRCSAKRALLACSRISSMESGSNPQQARPLKTEIPPIPVRSWASSRNPPRLTSMPLSKPPAAPS